MKVEFLFPAIANLFGEEIEMRYIKKCLPDAEFFETPVNGTPKFASEDVDLIYLGPMTEHSQEIVIDRLRPFKDRIIELIDAGKVFLAIGNALEIFGDYIENEDGSKTEGLGIFNIHAKREMMKRFNCLFLGEFEGMKIVGFKAQFSQSYGLKPEEGLFRKIRGGAFNPDDSFEGVRRNNFFGTYVLGPILILNPDFTKYLLTLLGKPDAEIPCEKDIRAAYERRLKEFEKPDIVLFG